MRKIIIVQHCQSEHHVNDMSGGWTDTPLTELGKLQANLIGERLMNELKKEEYVIYSSDLLRAKETADIIGNLMGLEVHIDKGLREINTGVAAGKTKEWARNHRNPRKIDGFDLDYQEWLEGETWREFNRRVCDCMDHLWNTEEKNLILVTHGCTLSYIVSWWLKFEEQMLVHAYFSASPASISILEDNYFKQNALKLLNDTSHLSVLKSTEVKNENR